MRYPILAGASALALLLGARGAPAAAQATPSATTTTTAPSGTVPAPPENIVVTATRSDQALTEVPESVSVLTARQIEGTAALTIDDVLRYVPSVDLPLTDTNEQDPTDTNVSMRGLSGIRTLVLLDGVPINDPFFGFVQWSEVPLETIDRVEVVRGGGATLWGNYAMGGVINILTRPDNTTGLVLEAAGGSRGTVKTDGHAALAGRGVGLGLDVGVSHSDGYVEQVAGYRGAVTVPTSYTSHTVALSGTADLASDLTARTRLSYYDNDQNFLTHLETKGQRTWRGTGTLGWKPDARSTLDLTVFADDSRFTTNNTDTPAGADPLDAEYIENAHHTQADDLGTSLVWRRTFSGPLRSLSAGADYHDIRGSDVAAIYDDARSYLRTDTGAGDQRFVGGFAQAELRPVERLQVLFSIRYQDFRSSAGRDDTPGGLGDHVPSRHDNDVDPRLSLRYQLPGGFALRGAAYRAFRAPTLDNLYRTVSLDGYIYYADAGLKPETLDGGEVGVDFERGPVRIQATAYNSDISNLITYGNLPADTLPAGFNVGARLLNAGSARARGFEAELNWHPSRRLDVTFAYTFADSVVTSNPDDPGSVGVQQPGIPKNRASLLVDWTAPDGIRVSPRLRYTGGTSGDTDGVFHTEANVVADLTLSVPVRKDLDGFIQIENLFDSRYTATNDGFTAPLYGKPFTAWAGLRLRLP